MLYGLLNNSMTSTIFFFYTTTNNKTGIADCQQVPVP